MNSKRIYILLMAAIGVLFIGLLAGTYEINSILSNKATNLTKLKAKSVALNQEQTSLVKAKKDIKRYEDLYKITQSVVPEDKSQAEAVREIVKIADQNGINLASITFPASTLGASATGAAGVPAPAAAAPVSAGAKDKTSALSQLQPVKSITGVYSLTITVARDPLKPGPYNQFVSFLGDLEHNRRTAQVNTITIEPKKDNRSVLSFTLTLNEYIKP